MINASSDFIRQLISGEFVLVNKIELLTKEEIFLDDISDYIIDGVINVDKDKDTRRNLSLTLKNINNRFTPIVSLGNTIWLDKKIRVSIGIRFKSGEIEYIPQGIFNMTKLSANSSVGEVPKVRIEGVDKMGRWGKTSTDILIKKGVNIGLAIRSLLSSREHSFVFDDTDSDAIVPYDLSYPIGTDYVKIAKELANIITWDIGYNVYGELRFKKFPQPENGVVTWTYQKEDYTLYSGSEKSLDDTEFANSVIVIGSGSQSATCIATAKDEDLLSPYSIHNIGERLYIHNNGSPDPLITSYGLAKGRCDYELRKRLQIVERQNLSLVPNFLHEEGDVIRLIDDAHLTNDKYELLKFSIPLNSDGRMSAECWRTRRLL